MRIELIIVYKLCQSAEANYLIVILCEVEYYFENLLVVSLHCLCENLLEGGLVYHSG